jgi:hypothetical protein
MKHAMQCPGKKLGTVDALANTTALICDVNIHSLLCVLLI